MKRALILTALLVAGCKAELIGPVAIDGDTFKAGSGPHYRLARIDAPEMPGHCRRGRHCVPGDPYAAKRALQGMLDQGPVRCTTIDVDVYRRKIVECRNRNGNLSDAMLELGFAQLYVPRTQSQHPH